MIHFSLEKCKFFKIAPNVQSTWFFEWTMCMNPQKEQFFRIMEVQLLLISCAQEWRPYVKLQKFTLC